MSAQTQGSPCPPCQPRSGRSQAFRRWRHGALAGLLACALPVLAAEDPFFDKLLVLGTGAQGGAFLPIGETLCEAVNAHRQARGVRCVAPPTAGSVYNINAVNHGRLQLGLAQEDLVLDHIAGRRGPGYAGLRVVAVTHESPISVVVRGDAPVQELSQIKGLRLNMGNRGSGQHAISTAIIKALALTEKDFAQVLNEPTSAFESLFCGGQVDVLLEILPHPAAVVEKLLACGGRLLPIPPDIARKLTAVNPALAPMTIAANTYRNQPKPVESLGMRNLLISHVRVSPESISRVVQALAEQERAMKQEQPMLASMPALALGSASASQPRWPVHDGVLIAPDR